MTWLNDVRNSYDSIAASYAEENLDLLDRLPCVRAGVWSFRGQCPQVGLGGRSLD